MIIWKKSHHNLLLKVSGEYDWMNTHAQIPTAIVLKDRIRVYFATRPQRNLGLTTFVDLSKESPYKILYLHEQPIISLGKIGTFDHHGIFPSFVTRVGTDIYLYYVGWYRGSAVPYHNAVGLAISKDDGFSFEKLHSSPVLDRSQNEPLSMGSIWIQPHNNKLHMLYTEVFDWLEIEGKLEPIYHLKHAYSEDWINWTKSDHVCISSENNSQATARPTIVYKNNIFHMWFCYRSIRDFRDGKGSYRIGYASSPDMINWKREDHKAGIDVSKEGWDSKMITYPYIVQNEDQLIMLYNGNGFGESGFGYARASINDL